MAAVFWLVWVLACLLLAYGLIRAARDYRDDEPQPGPVWNADGQQWRHDAPDDQPGAHEEWAAAWNRRYNQPAYDPNHRTTKGD
ncbi:hypothetical protein [Streptomyces sp. YIM S03343]